MSVSILVSFPLLLFTYLCFTTFYLTLSISAKSFLHLPVFALIHLIFIYLFIVYIFFFVFV